MPADLCVCDLHKNYGDVHAVRGVSFEAAGGEIFGLLGPNGAGKTSTLECILGLRRPDAGTITLAGINAIEHPLQVKQMIGAALQSTSLQDKITPREALRLFGSFYRNAIKPNELLNRFDLADKADVSFDTLSGGQKQRLALALAFINHPRFVFLDEPTAGLDPASRRELHAVIRKMRDDGHTVVLTTHYIEEAGALCDRIAIINQGRVVAAGKPAELIAAAKVPARILVKTARPMNPAEVQSLPAVFGAEAIDEQWQITTGDISQSTIGLFKLLEASGNDLVDLQIRRPSLEDVFLELTGMNLRET